MVKHIVLGAYLPYCMVYGYAYRVRCIFAILFGIRISIFCWVHICYIVWYMEVYRVRCISAVLYGIWVSILCYVHICFIVWYMVSIPC